MVDRTDLLNAAAAATPTRSGYWRSHCPFCEEAEGYTGKKNFTIRMATGSYWCWRCAEKGFIRNIGEAMFATVSEAQAQEAENELAAESEDEFEPPEGYVPLGWGDGAERLKYREAREYLWGRGIHEGTVEEAQIGAVAGGHRYAHSIVVPILDRGAWKGYVCRKYRGKSYLYPPGMKRGELFFNQDALIEDSDDPIFLVEGCFDALPHYPHAVACLGKPSHTHRDMLKRVKRPIAIVLDADAQREGWALAQSLKLHGVRAEFIKLPAGSDPGDADPDWLLGEVFGAFVA